MIYYLEIFETTYAAYLHWSLCHNVKTPHIFPMTEWAGGWIRIVERCCDKVMADCTFQGAWTAINVQSPYDDALPYRIHTTLNQHVAT